MILIDKPERSTLTTHEFMSMIKNWRNNPYLTPREKQICEYYEMYYDSRHLIGKITTELNISDRTLGQYRYLILEKFGYKTSLRKWARYQTYLANLDKRMTSKSQGSGVSRDESKT